MNRKRDHITHALAQDETDNDFDKVHFVHHSIPSIAVDDVSLKSELFGQVFDSPIYINAMTGGVDEAYEINDKLSQLAHHFNIPMAVGSLSNALKNIEKESYHIVREKMKDGFVLANIGADKSYKQAIKAVSVLKANALQVHVNAIQELIMPEGERDFTEWRNNIHNMVKHIDVPIIVKEVGFGMSQETMTLLNKLGVTMVDISGKGGTNFAKIENLRRQTPLYYLNNHGLSTVKSLLEARNVSELDVYASGGIRHPLDVVKALAMGAKGVGMSSYFLKLVTQKTVEEAKKTFAHFIHEIKLIMTALNCRSIKELKEIAIVFDEDILSYMKQRDIQ